MDQGIPTDGTRANSEGVAGCASRMTLTWSGRLPENARWELEEASLGGLNDFYNTFSAEEVAHDRRDVETQACILAAGAWDGHKVHADEARWMGWLAAATHAVDDLFDAPGENRIISQLRGTGLDQFILPVPGDVRRTEHWFRVLGRDVLVGKWGAEKYELLIERITKAAARDDQHAHMFAGFNRMMVGGSLFKPGTGLSDQEQQELLTRHNKAYVARVRQWLAEGPADGQWAASVSSLLHELEVSRMGSQWIGLTTKTVIEIFAGVFDVAPNPVMDTLHSLLYAPALYWHDIDVEAEREEMRYQREFEKAVTDLKRLRGRICQLIDGDPGRGDDPFREGRAAQREMLENCLSWEDRGRQ